MRWAIRVVALGAATAGLLQPASAVSCNSQSQISEAERGVLIAAAKQFGSLVETGNVAAVRAATIPSVASQFGAISSEITAVAPLMAGATLTVANLYALDASDLKAAEEQTQFFCGGQGSSDVVFSIPQIPPGRYAIAILHATGVAQPQQISFILAAQAADGSATRAGTAGEADGSSATSPSQWKLAGMFVRPLTSAGHDGLWYWNKARGFTKAKQNWNAYFYFQTAQLLLAPVDFVTTSNLDKLIKEQSAVAPGSIPGAQPMALSVNGLSYPVTALHTDGSLGSLDLVIAYKSSDNTDPVATRTRNVEVMQAMLRQHPEIREGFHGLWVYSNAPNQRPFANELPMSQIP